MVNMMHDPERAQRPVWYDLSIGIILVTLVIGDYAAAFRYGFVNFDDYGYVKENPIVARGFTVESLKYAWTTFDLGNWMPLTWMSLEGDAALFGVDPRAFHTTNILLHAANVMLFFLVLRSLTANRGCSAVAAALFAVHPLHVESVAWISERKDVLSTFWLLITLLTYQRYSQQPSLRRYLIVVTAFTAGMLSKSMLVTLPLLLILLDVWPLGRLSWSGLTGLRSEPSRRTIILEKVPLLCISFIVGVVTIIAQRATDSVANLETLSFTTRLLNAIHAYGWYLLKTVFPTNLCAHYLHPGMLMSESQVFVSGVVLFIISMVAWRAAATHPYLVVGWLWFLISLVPVIGLLQVGIQAYADRYTYVPHLGLFVALVWLIDAQFKRWRINPRFAIGLTVIVVLTMSVITRTQVATWRDNDALLTRLLEVNPESTVAHLAMAKWRHEEGKLDESAIHFQKVLDQDPMNIEAISRLGWIYHQQRNWSEAIAHYEWALRIAPQQMLALSKLKELTEQGVRPSAKSSQKGPIPEKASRLLDLGVAYARQGRMQDALLQFEEAIKLAPEYADPLNNSALALKHLGRTEEAINRLQQAIVIEAENVNSQVNLAVLLEAKGELRAASEHFAAALRIQPKDPELRQHLMSLRKKLAKP